MTDIISVRFRSGGKQYYFDPRGLRVREGQQVVVETGRGPELALCVRGNWAAEDGEVVQPLRPVLRLATQRDLSQAEHNGKREAEAMRLAQAEVDRHGLEMKLVRAEYSLDGAKIIFFFTADGRVDFRALVKDLAGIFRSRIELRQIGVRDEARMLGGLGICGKPFCCSQFLDEFQPVSIKMAKTQSLSLNPAKISGTCGRLMCCLKYEQDAYEDAARRCPRQDSFVECPDGVGSVCQVNLLKEQVKVKLEDSVEQPKSYYTDEIRVVRSGKGRRPEGYEPPPKEELEKLRRKPDPAQRRLNGWRMGDGEDLSSALERYLGASESADRKGGKGNKGRQRNKGGRGRQAPPQEQAPNRERQAAQRAQQAGARRQEDAPPAGEAKPSGSTGGKKRRNWYRRKK